MMDLQYTFMLQSFGMIRSNTLKEFVYRHPSFYAMRLVFSFFDEDTKRIGYREGVPYQLRCVHNPNVKERVLSEARFNRFGEPVHLYWFSNRKPNNEVGWDRIDLTIDRTFSEPVWMGMITGKTYTLHPDHASKGNGETRFRDIPMWDSPIMIIERSLIPFASGE